MRWLLLALVLLAHTASAAGPQQIVVFISDDQSPDTVSVYGPNLYTNAMPTPNIDRIAAAGAIFTNPYTVQSNCTPGRAAILTGRYWTGHQVLETNVTMDPGIQTAPDLLKAAGYKVAWFGKWNLTASPDTYTPTDVGIDYWDIFPIATSQGTYDNPTMVTNYSRAGLTLCPITGLIPSDANPCSRVAGIYSTDVITTTALAWMTVHAGEKIAVFIAVKGPHDPVVYEDCNYSPFNACYKAILPGGSPPNDFAHPSTWNDVIPRAGRTGVGKTTGTPLLDQFNAWQAGQYQIARPNGYGKAAYTGLINDTAKTEYQYQTQLKDYLRTLKSVDVSVGTVLDYLVANGINATTLLIYMADNGYLLGEHGGVWGKFNMYEESIRIPILMQYPCTSCGTAPAIAAGSQRPELTLNIDLAPTILEYAEIAVPTSMDGRSLVANLDGTPDPHWRTSFYYHSPAGDADDVEGVSDLHYKYMCYPNTAPIGCELIDLGNDPGERTDQFVNAAYASTLSRMQALMNYWQSVIGEGRRVSGGKLRGAVVR